MCDNFVRLEHNREMISYDPWDQSFESPIVDASIRAIGKRRLKTRVVGIYCDLFRKLRGWASKRTPIEKAISFTTRMTARDGTKSRDS
ncbi:uncharacterized protein EAE98_003659 [Botrytis deweyae]|uniref:Uncharacterized protein n=1 Tax=Botrytis deweyae TaxID=2478750 RepID=A0ABQ7IU70_9HELO|nr:uncharacterized protein EAE98_003659 [Botrytis deweyae]KAF7933950.1 hypothetical protein EAE98_003659 [Botrytis deweyae]